MLKILLTIALATANAPAQPSAALADERDGKTYRVVKIGAQVWMAENLNYEAEGSKCYDNKAENCAKYGRLYNWKTAMEACPSGWHLPDTTEWNVLVDFAGGKDVAGKKLKAKSGWDDYEGKSCNGEDKFGFAALPGGLGSSNGNFSNVGYNSLWWSARSAPEYGKDMGLGINLLWWSAPEYGANYAYSRSMSCISEYAYLLNGSKTLLQSVRCVMD